MLHPEDHFPEYIDSSMRATFRECPRKFYWQYIRCRRAGGDSVHLVAGGAFARGLEIARRCFYILNYTAADSVALGLLALTKAYGTFVPPEKYKNKSWERTAGALVAYLDKYPLGRDYPPFVFGGNPCIEFSFAIPLSINHPDTGLPLLAVGRADQIIDYNGTPYGADEKTTGSLGPTWADKWALRAQFMQYAWAMAEHGINIAGFLVRGVALKVTGYDFAEAICQPQRHISRWYAQFNQDIQAMLRCWHENEWGLDFGDACNAYGGCPYRELVCSSTNPEPAISMYFERNIWNPLTKEKPDEALSLLKAT